MADDIYVTVAEEPQTTTVVEGEGTTQITTVGEQGLSSTTGNVEDIANIDTSNLEDGALLIYNASSTSWVSGKLLEKQEVEAGEF